MKRIIPLTLVGALATRMALGDSPQIHPDSEQHNACDSGAFLAAAMKVERIRDERTLTEAEFARAAKEPGTIVLDARGSEFYRQLHVKGASNLPFTHFSDMALSTLVRDRSTRILIYCRNNLKDAPEANAVKMLSPTQIAVGEVFLYPEEYDPPEIPKSPPAGLNIPTFITLFSYGYENVWELRDVVDPNDSEIEFEGEVRRGE